MIARKSNVNFFMIMLAWRGFTFIGFASEYAFAIPYSPYLTMRKLEKFLSSD